MLGNTLTYLFPGGRALKLIRNGVNVTNSSNPSMLIKNITFTVIDCCAPPPLRLASHCLAAGALVTASIISPNPVTIGSSIHIISELYDNC